MDKTLEYYMALPYTIELTLDTNDGWFVAVRELPGCMSQGDTPEEAIEMIRDAMEGWLSVALEDGITIPEPRKLDEYSGKFVVRVPRSLHRDLVLNAEQEGVSLNQYVNVALAHAVGQRGNESPATTDGLGWPGLNVAMRRALVAAGYAEDAGALDEQLFAQHVEHVLSQARAALEGGYQQDACPYLAQLHHLLCVVAEKSPVIQVLDQAIELLYQQMAQRPDPVISERDLNRRIAEHMQQAMAVISQNVARESRVEYARASFEFPQGGSSFIPSWKRQE